MHELNQSRFVYVSLVLILFLFSGCSQKVEDPMINKALNQFAPTVLKFDATLLDERQMKVVEKLYQAATIMDEIFLDQVYSGNTEIKESLLKENNEALLAYFNIMFGPFDRLEHDKPFIGTVEKPDGANFYPQDMTKEEFNKWIEEHPEDEAAFISEFTIIRRENGGLRAIPYSEYYKDPLTKASVLLREAADFADNPSLKRYLITRAEAFLSNDYYESDMAWMDLKDHTIEVVIGPYEVYEDELFNYKAAFECFITLKDPEESKKLSIFSDYLLDIEKNLPIPDKYKNFERGSESPIMVVQEVFSAGDTKAGVQTLAFNLPNDERVREAKGSKKVMLKNMHEAKFEKQLIPIAAKVLDESQQQYVNFDAFFNHTLMHEISHGVGPGKIVIDGRETTVKNELKETYSKLEECKADVLGMYNNRFMIDKGVYSKADLYPMWSTFLAGVFRSIRFGITEAHGAGNAIIYNFLLEKGAYQFDESTGRVKVDYENIENHVKDLAEIILRIQAEGDYDAALNLIEKYAYESPSMKLLVDKLQDLPVDIKPEFQIEDMLSSPKS